MRMPLTASRAGPVDSPDALQPGAHLGEYRIERLQRAGGFSATYLAIDRGRDIQVVIEEYLPMPLAARGPDGAHLALRQPTHAAAFERGLQAFTAEADLLARCVHPALPRIQRRWRANGTGYREMPFVAATPLRSLREGMAEPPDEEALRQLLDGALGALDILHAAGYVHGAVSPDTILLRNQDDSPLLFGFDAAQRAIVGGQAQALMRSIGSGYAVRDGGAGEPGPAADVYAIAAVMRFCINGEDGRPTALASAGGRAIPSSRYTAAFLDAIDAALAAQLQSVAQFRTALVRRGRGGPAWPRPEAAAVAVPPPDAAGAAASNPALAMPPVPAPPMVPTPTLAVPPAVAAAVREAPLVIDFPPRISDDFRAERRDIQPPIGREDAPAQGTLWQRLGVWAGSVALLAAIVFAGWQVQQQWRNNATERGLAQVTEGRLPMTVTVPVSAARPVARAGIEAGADAAATQLQAPPPAAGAAASVPVGEALPMQDAQAVPVPVPASAPASILAPTPPAVTPREPSDPLAACSPRTPFALYRCMQTQCDKRQWRSHPQCVRLREEDRVG